MKIKKGVLGIFILIILSVSVFGTYEKIGTNDQDFILGEGNLNALNDVWSVTGTKALSDSLDPPLVADLDGDGINEIIVKDGSTIKIYQNNTLNLVNSFDLTVGTNNDFSNMIVHDMDGITSTLEIVIIYAPDTIPFLHIINFTGATLTNISRFPILDGGSYTLAGDFMISCEGLSPSSGCLAVTSGRGTNGASSTPRYEEFSKSLATSETTYLGSITGVHCFPKIKHIAYDDYDQDGTSEYVWTTFRGANSVADELYLSAYDPVANTLEKNIQLSTLDAEIHEIDDQISGAGQTCATQIVDRTFTSPIIFNFDAQTGNGLEVAVGHQANADEFGLFVIDLKNEVLYDDFPEVTNADGQLLSNPFVANIYTDTDGENEVCIFGFDNTADELELWCGASRDRTGQTPQTVRFTYDTTGVYDVNTTWRFNNLISHSTQQISDVITEDGNSDDLSEVVTTYGIFKLDWTGVDHDLLPIFPNPRSDGAVILADYEGLDLTDMLITTQTNLYYVDDGFVNSDGQITSITIDPCVDAVWKINTSVEVIVNVEDINGDKTGSKVVLYEGDSNEIDSGWSANFTSGTDIPFNFIANETIPNGVLTVYGRDKENPNNIDSETFSFSVALNGVEKGDCETIFTESLEAEATQGATTFNATGLNQDNNSITNGLSTLLTSTNAGIGVNLLWLIFMGVIAMTIMYNLPDIKGFVTMIIVEVLMIIIGVSLGIMSVGVLIILIVIALAILGMAVGKVITGST